MLHRFRPTVDNAEFLKDISSFKELSDDTIIEFENTFSRYVGTKLSLATDKGRTALFIALKLLKIKKEDEIIIQNYTCKTAIDPLLQVGAKIKLVDIDENFNLSITSLKKLITNKTKLIISTHLFGQPCNIEEIYNYARENNIYLIEDSCQCLGGKIANRNVGTLGDISIFSFNIDKPFTVGEGGMLCINNLDLISDALLLKNDYQKTTLETEKKILYSLLIYNILTDKTVYKSNLSINFAKKIVQNSEKIKRIIEYSINNNSGDITKKIIDSMSRIDFINLEINDLIYSINNRNKLEIVKGPRILMNSYRAKFGLSQLNSYEKLKNIRNENAKIYENELSKFNKYKIPFINKNVEPAFLRYSILNKSTIDTKQIYKKLCKIGYEVGNFNWPKTINLRSPYNKIISYNINELQNSMNITNKIIQLPIHSYVEKADIYEITKNLQ